MSQPPAPSPLGLLHAVPLSAYFADAFGLVYGCSPSSSSLAPHPCGGPPGYTAGGKRRRSSVSCASAQGTTQSSELHAGTVDAGHVAEAGDGSVPPTHAAEAGTLLLVPTATSLTRLGPSGSWLSSQPPSAPEEEGSGGCAAVESQARASPPTDEGSKTANTAELAALLHPALLECYRVEDALLQRRREAAAKEAGTRLCAAAPMSEEKLWRAMRRPCPASLPASPGAFERTLDLIESQKRRRREQSERLEAQAREIARVKELPILVEDAVRYAKELVEWSCKGGGGGNTGVCHAEAATPHSDEPTADDRRLPAVTTPVCAGSAASDDKEASQMLYAKFPPPLFHTSSFAAGVGRLLRWVRTWQRAMPRGVTVVRPPPAKAGDKNKCGGRTNWVVAKKATLQLRAAAPSLRQGRQRRGEVETSGSSSSLDAEASEGANGHGPASTVVHRRNEEARLQKRTARQRYHDNWMRMADSMLGGGDGRIASAPIGGGSPLEPREESEYGLASDHVMYDEYGNRLRSVRLAKKMAEKRALREEAQKAREQRRGYFARAEEEARSVRRTLFDEVSDSGSDDASDDSNDDVTNIAVLHGPCGVGKTAIVYLVAEILGYRVVEMNTSVRRCPKNIDRLLSEVTRSRRLSDLGTGRAMLSIEEELKKLKKEHAAPLAAAAAAAATTTATAPTPARKERNGKSKWKGNAISAEAVTAFFRPRVKAEPPEVVLVDAVSTAAVDDKGGKRQEGTSVNVGATLAAAAAATAAGPACGGPDGTTRTLLLFEDADVILGDEAMKPFYAAVRELAQRSKVPIVVTMSSTASTSARPVAAPAQDVEPVQTVPIDAAQVSQFFGKRTPFTAIEPMPRSALFTQLLLVAAVERGLVAVQRGAPPCREERDEGEVGAGGGLHRARATAMDPALPATPLELLLVRDVEKFQRLADAIRGEVYSDDTGTASQLPRELTDVRRWLNRLQYLRLVEHWPTPVTLREPRQEECMAGEVCILPTQLEACADRMEVAGLRSHWDRQLGRVLRAPAYVSSAACSTWEWQQFQYAEEVAADANANSTWGDGVAGEARSSNGNNSSGEVVPKLQADASAAAGLAEVLQGAVPIGAVVQPRHREGVDVVRGRCTTTTQERIDAFGAWWRRTRKTDAIKSFVAARSSAAYEDVVGFGCLLQQTSPTGKGLSG
ncbi:uncharacterized protein Tco025E_02696 [Trypanosoma conorhini]|uniref:Uncharacterized protein n=1 Tax=Trypanosoma conorhini TaxID=83891 RepID=A0A422Q1V4_9TRYP|nr:uncharacterized protein Tco025E_02696 [Trypanosoma conorhini]RNF23938.1 hypothetical protein Tco025E_02696 [Trypanosoma conorhini]